MIENRLKNIAISTSESSVEEIESLRKISEELGLPLLDFFLKETTGFIWKMMELEYA